MVTTYNLVTLELLLRLLESENCTAKLSKESQFNSGESAAKLCKKTQQVEVLQTLDRTLLVFIPNQFIGF